MAPFAQAGQDCNHRCGKVQSDKIGGTTGPLITNTGLRPAGQSLLRVTRTPLRHTDFLTDNVVGLTPLAKTPVNPNGPRDESVDLDVPHPMVGVTLNEKAAPDAV